MRNFTVDLKGLLLFGLLLGLVLVWGNPWVLVYALAPIVAVAMSPALMLGAAVAGIALIWSRDRRP